NTIDLAFPDQVPLRSGIASCARADVAAAPRSANAKTRYLIASSRADADRSPSWIGWGTRTLSHQSQKVRYGLVSSFFCARLYLRIVPTTHLQWLSRTTSSGAARRGT